MLRISATETCDTAASLVVQQSPEQLRAAGWVLLPVPYWEWNEDLSSSSGRQEYLRAALRHVLPAAERHSLIQKGVTEIPSVT